MRLWSIQSVDVLNQILNNGVYRCNKIRSALLKDESFIAAYDWMAEKMRERVGLAPEGVEYPVWAWYIHGGRHRAPDLRQRYAARGKELVRIELEVPDEVVLLSDFDKWHYVINEWFLPNVSSVDEFEESDEYYHSLSEERQREEMLVSWEGVFDIERTAGAWCSGGEFIQATLWELKREYVRTYRFFVSK